MRDRVRVLVSGAGGDVGHAVIKALRRSELPTEVFATCIRPESPGLFVADHGFVAPRSDSTDYLPFVVSLIHKFAIDVFIPTVDSEMALIAKERTTLETTTGVKVFVNDATTVAVADDKLATAHFLEQEGFPFPRTMQADDPEAITFASDLGYPIIAKPRRGRGSRGVAVVHDAAHLQTYLGDDQIVLQEWLDPVLGEFTSGIYLGDDQEVKGVCILERELRHGSTHVARRICDENLERPLIAMTHRLGAKYLNVQAMRRGNELVPFELNGRLSGTTAMVSRVFNAPEMFIRERVLGERLYRVTSKQEFVALRFLDEIYVSPAQINELERVDGV